MDRFSRITLSQGLFKLIVLSKFAVLGACGSPTEEVEIKEYRLAVNDSRAEVQDAFRYLVASFNQDVGFEAIQYTEDRDQANSFINVTKGLEQRDGKVGWGQWIRTTETSGGATDLFGGGSRVYRYSMKLEFDDAYITSRWNRRGDNDEYDLKKLFYHEVGHGFQMNHVSEVSDIMYYDISGQKKFTLFFRNVRNFFTGI